MIGPTPYQVPSTEVFVALPARTKPLWRGWLHLAWFEVFVVFGTILIELVHGVLRTTAAVIYTVSVTGLFGTSALYHRGNWSPRIAQRMQRMDHAMIFILIAGSATPLFLVVVPQPLRTTMLVLLWALTALALVARMTWMTAPEVVVGGTYIALGCIGIVALPFAFTRAGVAVFVLLLAGGLLYALGALQYHVRWPDPRPNVFGFHEVFHVFVCLAATAHYIAIALVLTVAVD